MIQSGGHNSDYDITEHIEEALAEQDKKDGIVTICVLGSTLGVVVMRYEKGAVKDLLDSLERIAPSAIEYEHFKTTHDPNGFAHIKSCILGQSVVVPYENGKLVLPNKHKIVIFDFDLCSSERKVYIDGI